MGNGACLLQAGAQQTQYLIYRVSTSMSHLSLAYDRVAISNLNPFRAAPVSVKSIPTQNHRVSFAMKEGPVITQFIFLS